MKYYSFDLIESKNKLFNFIVTPRSAGKTIAMKIRSVEKYLKDKSRFVYVRRSGVEIENKKLTMFFEKMQSLGYHREHKLTFEKGIFYCDGEPMGYGVALSTSLNERSVDFVNVKDIYFEEFCMRPDSNHRYLDNEVERFLDLYSTIAREDEVKVWFLGNKLQEFNPYYLYFDLRPKDGLHTYKDFAIETWNDLDFVNEKMNTRFGKLIAGTAYSDYSIKNIGYANNFDFKRKLPTRSYPFFRVVNQGHFYTVYECPDRSMQITCDSDSGSIPTVFLHETDRKPEYMFVKAFRKTMRGVRIRTAIEQNMFYHTDGKSEEVGQMLKRGVYFV